MADFSSQGLLTLLREKLGGAKFSKQIERSFGLAYKGHLGQFRDQRTAVDAKIPYIVHPVGVALLANELLPLVNLEDSFEDIISVCLTHDLVEDSEITPQELAGATSKRTSDLVRALTKPPVQAELTRQQRDDRFIAQIIEAGHTAMFVKICDHLHNLSRPNQTPSALMAKAIRKGRFNYLRFFDEGQLPAKLRDEYLKRLSIAEARHALDRHARPAAEALSLASAVSHCVSAAEKKVLEIHDVAEIIQDVTRARFVLADSIDQFLELALNQGNVRQKQQISSQARARLEKGQLDLSAIPRSLRNPSILGDVDCVFAVEIEGDYQAAAASHLFVGVESAQSVEWVTLDTLRVVVTFLSERLRIQRRNRLRGIAMDLATLGLDLHLDDVVELGFTHRQLVDLRELSDYAEYVRATLHQMLAYELRTIGSDSDLPHLESRVKTPKSVARKMGLRRLKSFSEVDDVVGLRVVCLSTTECREISNRLQQLIEEMPFIVRAETPSSASGDTGVTTSSTGYLATHLAFRVRPLSSGIGEFGCEIQVRTVFQDAWAKVSHAFSYKTGAKGKEIVPSLKRLAETRDESDEIIDRLR